MRGLDGAGAVLGGPFDRNIAGLEAFEVSVNVAGIEIFRLRFGASHQDIARAVAKEIASRVEQCRGR